MTVDTASTSSTFSAANAVIEPAKTRLQFEVPTDLPPNHPTDHIVEVDYDSTTGWSTPHIHQYRAFQMDPSCMVLHYAVTCFEGMKAYRSRDGKLVRMFRPYDNMRRLNDSADRLCLPRVDVDEAVKLLEMFLKLDERFIMPGHYIYMRPLLMGTDNTVGIKTPSKAKFVIMATMFPPMNKDPLKLYCSSPDTARAWPGGFGYAKLGANYGPTLLANREAVSQGYNQVLWLLGEKGLVTEAGASNFFVVMKNKEGRTEILTCPLSTGVILPGVTRRSVLELLRDGVSDEADVIEREFTIGEIEEAVEENRIVEAFSVGTAYFVAPVQTIRTSAGKDLTIPVDGKYAAYAKSKLSDIMWGEGEHPWAHKVPVDN
uniref:Branched-chain-amino-acid aminotransferase n=1 Tax=Blastobotrys adeninivorans TaxID=409370 RepID=A0A060TG73_BLAAD